MNLTGLNLHLAEPQTFKYTVLLDNSAPISQSPESKVEHVEPKENAAIQTTAFPQDIIKAAQDSQKKWGIPSSVTLAQWAKESAFGKSMPIDSNNPFGIKALAGEQAVSAITPEHVGGKDIKIIELKQEVKEVGYILSSIISKLSN